MLSTLRLRPFLVPVNDGLFRDAVLLIQNLAESHKHVPQIKSVVKAAYLQNLREHLDDACVFVAIHLHDVDQGNLILGASTERREDRCKFLQGTTVSPGRKGGKVRDRLKIFTPTSRKARFSIWSGRALQSTDDIKPCQMHCTSSASGSGCSCCFDLMEATI
jgi:hypothetical protein